MLTTDALNTSESCSVELLLPNGRKRQVLHAAKLSQSTPLEVIDPGEVLTCQREVRACDEAIITHIALPQLQLALQSNLQNKSQHNILNIA